MLGLKMGVMAAQRRLGLALAPFNPFTGSPGAGGYYSASFAEGRWQDAAGTIPAVAQGDPVLRVDDQSENGYDLIFTPDTHGAPTLDLTGPAPRILSPLSGYWTLPAGALTGDNVFVAMMLHRTHDSASHIPRYSQIYVTSDGADGDYLDKQSLGNKGQVFSKHTRTGGTDNRAISGAWDDLREIGEDYLYASQAGLTYTDMRVDREQISSFSNTGTALVESGKEYRVLQNFPSGFYAMVFKSDDVDYPRRDIYEHAMLSEAGQDVNIPLVYAHRGFAACFDENSLTAFKSAGAGGFLNWECDVQASADGTAWLFHDATVDALTGGTGNFSDLTDAYIGTLTYTAGGSPIARLDDFLALAASDGAERLEIEVKDKGTIGNGFVDTVLAEIAASAYTGYVSIASALLADITYLRTIDTTTPVGFLAGSAGGTVADDVDLALTMMPAKIIMTHTYIDNEPENVEYARANGVDISLYTLGGAGQLRAVYPYKPHMLIADNPLGAVRGDSACPVTVAYVPPTVTAAEYDPSDLTTLWQDPNRTVQVTAAGQTVAVMDDKSGNGYHARQATTSKRPTYQTNGQGRHWLAFDGGDALDTDSIDLTGTGQLTTYCAFENGSTNDMVYELGAGASARSMYLYSVAATTLKYVARGDTFERAAQVNPGTAIAVSTAWVDLQAPLTAARANGGATVTDTQTHGASTAFDNDPLYIGSRNGTSLYFTGKFFGLTLRAGLDDETTKLAYEADLTAKSAAP